MQYHRRHQAPQARTAAAQSESRAASTAVKAIHCICACDQVKQPQSPAWIGWYVSVMLVLLLEPTNISGLAHRPPQLADIDVSVLAELPEVRVLALPLIALVPMKVDH